MKLGKKVVVALSALVMITAVCAAIAPLLPANGELDRLVGESRAWLRWWYVAQLVRIGLVLLVVLLFWNPICSIMVSKFGIRRSTMEAGRWRVFAWYAAFESVFMLSYI